MKGISRFLKLLMRTVEVVCILLFAFAVSLLFRDQSVPASWVEAAVARVVQPSLKVELDSISFGFRRGVVVDGLRVFERGGHGTNGPAASADRVVADVFGRRLLVVGARYPRLFASYYAPENTERDEAVSARLPRLPRFSLELERPAILGVEPERVVADVSVSPKGAWFERIHLDWPESEEGPMAIDGRCAVDLAAQTVEGEVRGTALQRHIRPMLVALDLPVSLPYIDAFTEVPGKVPASCAWHVNLVNSDFTLDLGLHPALGRYRGVPMTRADGDLHLFVYTRGDHLNYHHVFGPIVGVGPDGAPLEGTVVVDGTNGFNTVTVDAKSHLPVADLLKIGGFEDDYVGDDVFGASQCSLEFRFPRSMTDNYEVLNGRGSLSVKDGHLMRLKGFKGLVAMLAEKVPGVSWFTDVTQGSCDYVIENGVLRSDNIYIEGTVFSVKMYGKFDAVNGRLDFTARVQFTKKDSFAGKILHPLTWPFTKLLLEFRLTGSPGDPKWEYVSVVDRVVEAAK